MLLKSPLKVGAHEEHPTVGAPQEPGSVLPRSRSQGRLLLGVAISHHPCWIGRASIKLPLCGEINPPL